MGQVQRLKDRVCLITGGAQGLGAALAKRLMDEGARVMIADINLQQAQVVASRLNVLALRCDVTKYGDCLDVVQATIAQYGRIDILVSNAAIYSSGSIDEIDPETWKRVIDVNLCGSFNIMKAVVPAMIQQASGSIIQINSKSGKKGSYRSQRVSGLEVRGHRAGAEPCARTGATSDSCECDLSRQYAGFSVVGEPLV